MTIMLYCVFIEQWEMEMTQAIWEMIVTVLVAGFIVPAVSHPLITIPALIGLTGFAIWTEI